MANKHILAPNPQQSDGITLGESATQKSGFHGAAVVQRAGAAQAAVPATAIAEAAGDAPTAAEYATAVARINALTTIVNELRAALVEKGVIKGAA